MLRKAKDAIQVAETGLTLLYEQIDKNSFRFSRWALLYETKVCTASCRDLGARWLAGL